LFLFIGVGYRRRSSFKAAGAAKAYASTTALKVDERNRAPATHKTKMARLATGHFCFIYYAPMWRNAPPAGPVETDFKPISNGVVGYLLERISKRYFSIQSRQPSQAVNGALIRNRIIEFAPCIPIANPGN